MNARALLWAALASTSSACLADRLDELPSGVFACAAADECGDGQFCVLERCRDAAPPRLQVRSPEPDQIVAARPGDAPGMATFAVGIGGEGLVLVDPADGGSAVVGEGTIELWVDGVLSGTVTGGNVVSGVSLEVTIPATPGVHRILARAMLTDGTRYDNPEAVATQIVWIDDGRPHIAVVDPWPGDEFPLEETNIDIEVSSLNFPLFPATDPGPNPSGHAHIHYDDVFPECVDDPSCDCCYLTVLGPAQPDQRRASSRLRLPPSAAAEASITAVLRQTNHLPFTDEDGEYVFETIPIERRDVPPALDDTTGGGESTDG